MQMIEDYILRAIFFESLVVKSLKKTFDDGRLQLK